MVTGQGTDPVRVVLPGHDLHPRCATGTDVDVAVPKRQRFPQPHPRLGQQRKQKPVPQPGQIRPPAIPCQVLGGAAVQDRPHLGRGEQRGA